MGVVRSYVGLSFPTYVFPCKPHSDPDCRCPEVRLKARKAGPLGVAPTSNYNIGVPVMSTLQTNSDLNANGKRPHPPTTSSPDDPHRNLTACDSCKARKVKCDRAQPSCEWCRKVGVSCVYQQKRKPGVRPGYGKELEERVEMLERLLARQNQPLQPSPVQHYEALPVTPTQGSTIHVPIPVPTLQVPPSQPMMAPPSRQTPAIHSSGSSFNSDFPADSVVYHLLTVYCDLVHPNCPILRCKITVDTFFHTSPDGTVAARTSISERKLALLYAICVAAGRLCLPSPFEDLQRFRAQAKSRILLRVLAHPGLLSLQALTILAFDEVGTSNGPSALGLVALLGRMVNHLRLATETTVPDAEPSDGAVHTCGANVLSETNDSIEEEGRRRIYWMAYILDVRTAMATALDCVLADEEVGGNGRRLPCREEVWQNAKSGELHIHDGDHTGRSSEDLSAAAALSYLGAELPCPFPSQPLARDSSERTPFSYQIEILRVIGCIHRFLRRAVDIRLERDVENWMREYKNLEARLNAWMAGLPIKYGSLGFGGGASVDPGWVLLHAWYNTAVIRLHSTAAYPAATSILFSSSAWAVRKCLAAVENVSSLCSLVAQHDLYKVLGHSFTFVVWVATRVLLVHHASLTGSLRTPATSPVATTSTGRTTAARNTTDGHLGTSSRHRPVLPDVRHFLTALSAMAKYWETASRYEFIIGRVIQELNEACTGRSPTNTSTSSESGRLSSVQILADMRRNAYDADLLISRQSQTERMPMIRSVMGYRSKSEIATPAAGGGSGDQEQGMVGGLDDFAGVFGQGGLGDGLDMFDWFDFPKVLVEASTGDVMNGMLAGNEGYGHGGGVTFATGVGQR
ncbi:hypothetical protein G7K_2307-t1 [Saitoella complicata NRRL Y-17804]|uniref:Zn(2)-C6 fungal-type domain-containing protein n=1 Tax=Saitoella complicata (strain BCRC 22490 / CBS 7301 / JCM 7358 / NBRC 10748 / NRRL Y-17804) TaxID=698492 RepID=A0A0E9NE89_SAICN|nr:hypothetical protein G7K_2307-t1 [Saitoella complicata NRRL Y-17804]